MGTALKVIGLEHLGIVRMRGTDAVKFLQGQLSNDVAQLRSQRSLLAGYHNPQGRAIALIRLVQWDTDDILAVIPRELATVVASRLSKFVLRAKVKVTDESAGWRVSGLVDAAAVATTVPANHADVAAGASLAATADVAAGAGLAATADVAAGAGLAATADVAAGAGLATSDAAAMAASAAAATGPVGNSPAAVASTIVTAASVVAASAAAANGAQGTLASLGLPESVGVQVRGEGAVYVCVDDQTPRWLVISPADGPSPVLDYPIADVATWQRLEVAAGQPQVYAATSEEFVAQMLNLDALNAIAFDKGCYTGQEVIARAHYRGRVKRRMQRFVSREACQLSPGDSGQLGDGRTFKVVQAAQLTDGRCDFLAVAPLVSAVGEPGDATSKLASGADVRAAGGATAGAEVAAEARVGSGVGSGAAAASSQGSPAADAPPVIATLAADQAALPYPLPD